MSGNANRIDALVRVLTILISRKGWESEAAEIYEALRSDLSVAKATPGALGRIKKVAPETTDEILEGPKR